MLVIFCFHWMFIKQLLDNKLAMLKLYPLLPNGHYMVNTDLNVQSEISRSNNIVAKV